MAQQGQDDSKIPEDKKELMFGAATTASTQKRPPSRVPK